MKSSPVIGPLSECDVMCRVSKRRRVILTVANNFDYKTSRVTIVSTGFTGKLLTTVVC